MLTNQKPLGLKSSTEEEVITPCHLHLGRGTTMSYGIYNKDKSMPGRLSLVQDIVKSFWKKWTHLYLPILKKYATWREPGREPNTGDLVFIAVHESEFDSVGKYRIARIINIIKGPDQKPRTLELEYKIFHHKGKDYDGGKMFKTRRSIQQCALLLPIAEQ